MIPLEIEPNELMSDAWQAKDFYAPVFEGDLDHPRHRGGYTRYVWKSGRSSGPLEGSRDAVKDLFTTPDEHYKTYTPQWLHFYVSARMEAVIEPRSPIRAWTISLVGMDSSLGPSGRGLITQITARRPSAGASLARKMVSHVEAFKERMSRLLSIKFPRRLGLNRPQAECWVEKIEGSTAACYANISGTVLPIEFPWGMLKDLGLEPQDHFLWRIPSDGKPRPLDVTLVTSTHRVLPAEKSREIDRLYEEYRGVTAEDILTKLSDF